MTPFGETLQILRLKHKVTQKEMANALGVSAAYLSALEHGHRGKPQWSMVQRIITYFNIIWDEAEELQYLASISDPKITIDSTRLSANATRLTNVLGKKIAELNDDQILTLISLLNSEKE